MQDDFILLAMMGEGGDGASSSAFAERKEFPPIRLRYDDAEVEDQLAGLEDIAEEEAIEEEEEEIGQGGAVYNLNAVDPDSLKPPGGFNTRNL